MLIRLPHSEIRLTWTTDWHFSAVAPGRRADDYAAALFAKVEFVREVTEKLKGAALCGGDVFHHKNNKHPGNSLNLIIRLIHALRRFPTGCVYGSIGNHDLSWDRMESLPHQPLGLLIASGVYRDLNEEPVVFTNEAGDVRVQVETFPYAGELDTLDSIRQRGKERPKGIDYRIGIVHAYGTPGDRAYMYGLENSPKIGYNELKDVEFDFLLWGHDHSREKTMTVGNVTHIRLGSLARAALNYDEVDRPVAIAVLALGKDGARYQEKAIPVKSLELVFSMADKSVDRVAKSDAVKEFFNEMDTAVGGIESADPREVLRALCPDDAKLVSLVEELCGL